MGLLSTGVRAQHMGMSSCFPMCEIWVALGRYLVLKKEVLWLSLFTLNSWARCLWQASRQVI